MDVLEQEFRKRPNNPRALLYYINHLLEKGHYLEANYYLENYIEKNRPTLEILIEYFKTHIPHVLT